MKAGWRIRRIVTGSGTVRKRLGRALVPLAEDGEIRLIATALRCGPLVLAAPNLLTLAHQSPALLAGGSGAWCVAAWRAGTAAPVAAVADEDQTEPDETADPAALRQAVVDRLLGWMEERPGIHLSEVYERYRALPGHQHLTDDQIRTALVTHYGIPWRRAVADPRKTAQRTRAGIHRDDLQPLPSPAANAPVAATATAGVTSSVAA